MCVITEKKLQLNIARLCCHNFLSLVVFWLGGARAPWAPPLATPMLMQIVLEQIEREKRDASDLVVFFFSDSSSMQERDRNL